MSETETRSSLVSRKTKETEVNVSLELDGNGIYWISTGLPFFDHLLQIFSKHSSFNLELTARGDLAVDGHHTVEDAGMCLGKALSRAWETRRGLTALGMPLYPWTMPS